MTVFLLNALGKLLVRLPESFARWLSRVLGDLIFFAPTRRRHQVLSNLHHCFPHTARAWRERTARKSCRRMVEMALFVLASPHMTLEQLRLRFQVDPTFVRRIRENAEARDPAVLLVPHFSMMEALTIVPALVEGPIQHVAAIYRPLNQPALDAWVKKTRGRHGMELLSRKAGFNRALEILRQRGAVAVLFDQNAGSRGLLTTFFGRVVSSTELPGLLAAKFHSRIGVIYTEHTGFWRGIIRLDELTRPDHSAEVVFTANQWLERKLSTDNRCCADWLWLHDRWRHQDSPQSRFRLVSKRPMLDETRRFYGWDKLPRKTRFWVRMPNWLGDIVMALPLLAALRRGRPDVELSLIVHERFHPLLERLEVADRLIPLPGKKDSHYLRYFGRLRYDYPDTLILLTNSQRGDLEAHAIRAPQRFGILRPGKRRPFLTHVWNMPEDMEEARLHQTRLWECFFQHFGLAEPLDLSPFSQRRSLPEEGLASAPIGLIPGTENSPKKRWPVGHWRDLIHQLPGERFRIFGTHRDVKICADVARGFPREQIENRAGHTDIAEFAQELGECRLLISNDTGGMHLANALGVPVIVIFGPTNPIRTGPIFEAPRILLQPPGCPAIGGAPIDGVSVEQVLQALSGQSFRDRNPDRHP